MKLGFRMQGRQAAKHFAAIDAYTAELGTGAIRRIESYGQASL